MKLEDRIHNIKVLLKHCPHSTADTVIVEEKVGLFFANLFNNNERFKSTPYDHVYPRIYLSETLNIDNETYSSTIAIEYVYDSDRDGNYCASYDFNDPDLEDAYFYREFKDRDLIEYSEVPDNIWEIIQIILYKKATENINYELISAKRSVEYWEKKLLEFNNNLELKK